MAPRDRKYVSPYDPNYMGKMERPQDKRERERREREQEQHRLRGCGDPNCAMCNPETAMRGGGNMATTRFVGGPFGRNFPMDEIIMEVLGGKEEVLRQLYGAREASGSGAPDSYTNARKAVAQYICEAPETAFDDIVGNEEALGLLRDAIQAPVKHKELYEAYGMKMPKGALLSGPPGCGKTMFAKAAAAEMKRLYGSKAEFISVSGAELQSPYVGETEAKIKAMFDFAREYQKHHGHPLLIFMDEAEVLLPDRTGRVRRVAPWEESQVATFLAEMDGMKDSGAFVLLATNRPEVIDQAVLRDGRCDFKIVVKRPSKEALEVILRRGFQGILLGDNASVDSLTFAAVECFRDPHKVILEAHVLGLNSSSGEVKDLKARAFCLEHIVSGAMAASVPSRAKRYAFARDKASGSITGVTEQDVMKAVNDLFEENKDLEHEFALAEFKEEFREDFMADQRKGLN